VLQGSESVPARIRGVAGRGGRSAFGIRLWVAGVSFVGQGRRENKTLADARHKEIIRATLGVISRLRFNALVELYDNVRASLQEIVRSTTGVLKPGIGPKQLWPAGRLIGSLQADSFRARRAPFAPPYGTSLAL